MHSVSDLTTSSRKTSGMVPPKLVGASTTIVGDKMYLFGGRLVAERRMVSDLYIFDLETFLWTKIMPHSADEVPGARYFHSADVWNNYLIIFGGTGIKPEGSAPDELVVLNDIRFFNIQTLRWLPPDPSLSRDGSSTSPSTADPIDPVAASSLRAGADFIPRARYAHLSAVSGSRLYIIGGQDLQNAWLDDVCVYDMHTRRWTVRRDYPRHAGTYRSVAVAAHLRVRDPAREAEARTATASSEKAGAALGPPGGRFALERRPSSAKGEYTPSENLIHLPYSADATDDFPNDIYLYSNYNFTDVKRELEVFSPQPGTSDFQLSERSAQMTGSVLPPGLRFPSGAICGTHLIFAGTYLAHSYQSYSIWALDLNTMAWTRLDPGAALATGSWFRAVLWNSQSRGTSKLLIFGNRLGSLVEDYNRRLLAWDDVAVLDLEAFGIYQPPRLQLDLKGQELGLAALEEGLLADFEVVCDDGRRISCSRRLLEVRWTWFREQRRLFRDQTSRLLDNALEQAGGEAVASDPPISDDLLQPPIPLAPGAPTDARPDPRLTPRALILSEPYAVTLALLQYLYAQALLTPLQHAPAVLSQLLLLSATYNIPHLQALVRHAMHRALVPTTSVGVYEVATLCGCQSLQIRALKAVMASTKRNAGNRARGNSSAGSGGAGSSGPSRGGTSSSHDRDVGGGGSGGGNGTIGSSSLGSGSTRPRGLSDVRGNINYGSPNDSTGFGGGLTVGGMGGYGSLPDGESPLLSRAQAGKGRAREDEAGVDTDNVEMWKEAEANPDSDLETASELPFTTNARPVRPHRAARGLSMDTIYMALNEAELETNDLVPQGSISPARAFSIFSPTFPSAAAAAVEREVRRREAEFPENCTASSSQRLSTLSLSPAASPPLAQLNAGGLVNRVEGFVPEDLLGRSEDMSMRRSTTGLDTGVGTSPQTLHPNAHVQNNIGPRPGFSNSTGQRARAAPNALFVPNTVTVGTSISDSECPSLSSSLSSGLNLPSTITANLGARGARLFPLNAQSPETPESPALPTPADINASFSSMNLNTGLPGSLNAIHEQDAMYYGGSGLGSQSDAERVAVMPMSDRTSPRSFSPVLARAGAGLRARFGKSASAPLSPSGVGTGGGGGNANYGDDGVSVIDITAPGLGGEADSARGWGFVEASVSAGRKPPASPALATFAPSESEHTAESYVEFRSPYLQEYGPEGAEPPNSAGSAGSSSSRNFLSRTRNLMKLRSGETGSSTSPPSSPTTPTLFSSAGGKWPRPPVGGTNAHSDNSRPIQSRHLSIIPGPMQQRGAASPASIRARAKAAKEEEKRRKKEEEKKRMEALAAQFAAGRAKGKDGASMTSGGSGGSGGSGSEDKRKSNNDWIEDGGMWGASMHSGWAGL